MFDVALPNLGEMCHADDATVVAAIEEWARVEAAASARRLHAIAELVRRRSGDDEREHWSCDYWDAAAAEVAAALGVSHGIASGQMQLGLTLRNRLPKVAALFMAGALSSRLVAVIAWRTHLIQGEEALCLVDTALVERATAWGSLSIRKLEQAIDVWIDRYDPGALWRARTAARSREVSFGAADDQAGTAAMWGRLYATDAAVVDRRLMRMAHAVCDDDPRTIAQRRADALGALAAGADWLACGCAKKDCAASGPDDARSTSVVINIVAEASAVDGRPDPHMSGDGSPPRPITSETTLKDALAPDAEPDVPAGSAVMPSAAVIVGGGVVLAPLLAELVRGGAKVRPVDDPRDAPPERRYRPSATLERFIRIRDFTCRFPGCDQPAESCDVDHTVPYPVGPTHPSNLKLLCRKHHLLKTFWTGSGGWADRQLADGTVIWTAPTGKTYTSYPGSRIFFPTWHTPSAELPSPTVTAVAVGDRGLMMPTRRRTRAAERAHRIRYERALNDAHIAERNIPPPY